MPSKNKQYNLVQSDDLDSRIPLMPEEAFQHGIPFNCKFIGSMDIPRPTSRVEIVAAMRRVRVEFKSKGVKKKKITLTVSVDGIKTSLRKKTRKRKKRSNSSAYVDVDGNNSMVIVSHPIYRIFYVSHDSQDVKIFSYIARETSSNVFHCCVFKAANKNQAQKIVRCIGQAFEVCHKLVGTAGEEDESEEANASDTNLSSQLTDSGNKTTEDQLIVTTPSQPAVAVVPQQPEPVLKKGSSNSLIGENAKAASSSSNTSTPPAILASALTPLHGSDNIPESASIKVKPKNLDLTRRDNNISTNDLMNLTTPSSSAVPTPTQSQSFFKEISLQPNSVALGIKGKLDTSNKENLVQVHEAQLLKEQLDQQTQNTRAALAQIQLLRDQLAAESAARIEAQARTHQLLIHNKELLDHLQTLVRHIQELEATTSGGKERGSMSSNNSIAAATAAGVTLPQLTGQMKIDRWFQFVVPAPAMSGDDDENDDGDNYSAADFESLEKVRLAVRQSSRRTLLSNKESGFVSANELTDSTRNNHNNQKRSSSRGGNTTTTTNRSVTKKSNANKISNAAGASASGNRHHHQSTGNSNRLSSTSSWLRRVLRFKRSSAGYYDKKRGHFYHHNNNSNSPGLLRVNSSKSRVSSL